MIVWAIARPFTVIKASAIGSSFPDLRSIFHLFGLSASRLCVLRGALQIRGRDLAPPPRSDRFAARLCALRRQGPPHQERRAPGRDGDNHDLVIAHKERQLRRPGHDFANDPRARQKGVLVGGKRKRIRRADRDGLAQCSDECDICDVAALHLIDGEGAEGIAVELGRVGRSRSSVGNTPLCLQGTHDDLEKRHGVRIRGLVQVHRRLSFAFFV